MEWNKKAKGGGAMTGLRSTRVCGGRWKWKWRWKWNNDYNHNNNNNNG